MVDFFFGGMMARIWSGEKARRNGKLDANLVPIYTFTGSYNYVQTRVFGILKEELVKQPEEVLLNSNIQYGKCLRKSSK